MGFPPATRFELADVCKPKAAGGTLEKAGVTEVVSSVYRDGRDVPHHLALGTYVVFEGESEYARRCFKEYAMLPDTSGRYAALYRPIHMIGLELGISVASAALRREPTGAPTGFRSDVVATAKRELKAGEMLDGEGGFCVWGRQVPAERSLAEGLLPLGLASEVRLTRDVAEGEALRWSDVAYDEQPILAVKVPRREMEARAFARPNEATGQSEAAFRRVERHQSTRAPEFLTTLLSRSVSAAMTSANSLGVLATIFAPSLVRRCRTSGSASALANSAFSRLDHISGRRGGSQNAEPDLEVQDRSARLDGRSDVRKQRRPLPIRHHQTAKFALLNERRHAPDRAEKQSDAVRHQVGDDLRRSAIGRVDDVDLVFGLQQFAEQVSAAADADRAVGQRSGVRPRPRNEIGHRLEWPIARDHEDVR